jgi:type IV pilus assembly protein PilA
MTRRGGGFTLIELMLVITVIGILAAVSFPAYSDYTRRARYVEGLSVAEPVRQAVAAYYDRWGSLPRDNAAAGLFAPETYRGTGLRSVAVRDGVIRIQFDEKLFPAHGVLLLRPAWPKERPTGSLVWVCQLAEVPPGFEVAGAPPPGGNAGVLPSACRGGRG